MVITFTPKNPTSPVYRIVYGNRWPRIHSLNIEGDEIEDSIQVGGGIGAALALVGERIGMQGGEYTHA